jgi:gliding motility-associated-like protein
MPLITSSNAAMCNGDKRLLTGTPTGGVFAVVGASGTMLTNDTLLASGIGPIQVRYRIANACGNNDVTQNITISSSISVAITNSTSSMCEDVTRALTGTPTGGVWNILNGPGTESGGVLTPTGGGTVRIEYAANSSCGSGADTVDIIINPTPSAGAGLDENICIGDTVTLTATGGGMYQWTPGPAIANNQVFPTVTTGYRVDVTSDSGCIANDSVTVFVQTTGTVSAQNDQAIVTTGIQESIDIYTNDVGGVNTIQILNGPDNGVGSISGGNVIYTSTAGYIGNDTVEYEICDANCQSICDTGFLYIVVESGLSIPTGVSVNGDGKNDVFNILGLNKYPDNSLKIFNRWGSLVFEAIPYLNDWAGKSLNGEVIEGTYFFVLKLGKELPDYNGYIELKK